MKLNHLKVNGFGKLKEKEIDLSDNINIIYGLNESGKSTLQKFITGTFFGLSKNKNGKEISDLEKYTPWNSYEFSGKIKYTLDNGENYEVFRDFNKKNPIIYDENKNDISYKFSIDKNKGNKFFEEQIGIDENTFLDTALTPQQNVKLNKTSQNNIIQKITNIISSGNENISYKKTLDKIIKMQNDKIGTQRSSQKPINIIEDKIAKLERNIFELQDFDSEQKQIEQDINKYENIIEKETNKLNLLKEMRNYLENSKFKIAELDFNKRLEDEYDEKIEDLKNRIDIKAKQNIRLQKTNYTKQYFILVIFIIVSIVIFVMKNKMILKILSILPIIAIILGIIIDKIIKKQKINEKLKQIEELQLKIKKEIEILKQNKDEKSIETKIKNQMLNLEFQKNDEYLINKYSGIIELNYIHNVLAMDVDDISSASNISQEKIEDAKIKLHYLKTEYENCSQDQIKLNELQEELNELNYERNELYSLNNSYNIAIECLEEAYKEMKEQINPNLNKRLCEMVRKISNGKYENIIFDDNNGLCVELNNGQYIPAEMLSIGTIDEMYLALRISVLKEISNENIPIILDEAFAYFDNERLKNLLEFISNEYKNNQIIIFTCSTREVEALRKINVLNYNLIELT